MNFTQGRVLHVVLSGLLLWFVSHGYCSAEHHSADQKPSTPSWKALREKAAHRRRRIIMNNDGNDVRGLPKDVPRTRETFLRQRICSGGLCRYIGFLMGADI